MTMRNKDRLITLRVSDIEDFVYKLAYEYSFDFRDSKCFGRHYLNPEYSTKEEIAEYLIKSLPRLD